VRVLMTMYGWADPGGGTIFPRQLAHALRARGHDVLVVHAATQPLQGQPPYAVRESEDDGVRLVAIHNRPTPFLDDKAPARELHDPAVARIVRGVLASFAPDVVHYHNFLGLSGAVAEVVRDAGVPSCYSPYNFWAVCPTLYLTLPDLSVCGGVDATGDNCLRCTGAEQPASAYVARRDRLRETIAANVGPVLASSRAVRDVLLANGHAPHQVRLLHAANERAERLWRDVGAARPPRAGGPLRIGFLGTVLPIKGVHVLVAAAQRLTGAFEVHVHGDGPPAYVDALRKLDRAGRVRWHGGYGPEGLAQVVRGLDVGVVPSICLDHSPMVVGELQAGRVPVVGARIGGIPDYLQADAGALVAPGDPDALAAALQALVDAPATVAAWQRRIAPPRTWGAYVDAIEGVYAELAANRTAPSAVDEAAPAPAAATPRKLNLGCGGHHLPGWLNVDKHAAARPDLVLDLERLPWPLPDDAADDVLLRHVLEHVGRDADTFAGIMRELYRVCAPDALVRVLVPHPRHQDFLQDPTHVRPIVPEMFLHWSLDANRDWQRRGLPGTPLAAYHEVDFAVQSVELRLDPHWQRWLDEDRARRQHEIDAIVRTHNNVVQECEIVLRAKKPFRGAS
jgi:glycosyltransferase involved in cell wall biosynthesis